MPFNLKGIQKKLMDKADWVAFLASTWERYDGNISGILGHYISLDPEHGFLNELRRNLTNIGSLKWSLWESPHLYTTIFKISTMARLGVEVGLIPPKYKKTLEKAMLGSGIAAITLPGSGPEPSSGSNRSLGSENPMEGVYA